MYRRNIVSNFELSNELKQINLLQFDFLNQSGRLNPFYKHTLQSMKDGNYPSNINQPENNHAPNNEATGSMYQSYYTADQTKVKF